MVWVRMCGRLRGTHSCILDVHFPGRRNEGVGIALDGRATAAWKEAREVWNAVGSCIVTARLKTTSVGQRRPGGSRETRNIYISIISVYAPTAKAPPTVMQKFMDDLQDTVDKISPLDVLILLGDFNARVGRREDDHLYSYVIFIII